jgi:hypothetical protein
MYLAAVASGAGLLRQGELGVVLNRRTHACSFSQESGKYIFASKYEAYLGATSVSPCQMSNPRLLRLKYVQF